MPNAMRDDARWNRIEQIFHEALALEPHDRAEYVQTACGHDDGLRERVESLLAQDKSLAALDDAVAARGRIGPYQLVSKLGAGGMGDVYLALDSRLGRRVAVKVLPPHFADNPERRRRFVTEARAASALNHPNIVAVHDFSSDGGLDYLVMEYVKGKPLDRLIPRNGLKLKEALGYAVQIAGALACANSAGIVHRDLKPGNVVITENGTAKILDFGIAKLVTETGTRKQTSNGVVVGTVAYMSPEQVSGAQVDARSDIFSFGVLLYEMTTGRHPFQRDSTAATLAAVVNHEPEPANALAEDVPPAIAAIIARCMRKDPDERFGSASELKTALTTVLAGHPGSAQHAQTKNGLRWIGVGGAMLAILAAVFLVWRFSTPRKHEPQTALNAVPLTTYPFLETSPTFSPDGSQVAFVWQGPKGDNFDIYVKVVGEDEPIRLTRDPLWDDAPAWSPDGRWIAFLRHLSEGQWLEHRRTDQSAVILIPATGGPERRIGTIYSPAGVLPRISWDPSSTWLAVPDKRSPDDSQSINLLSVREGEKRRVTFPPENTVGDEDPSFSPDGTSIAFSRARTDDTRDIYILRLTHDLAPAGEPARITFEGRWTVSPAWTPDSRSLVYVSGIFHNPGLWRTWLPERGGRRDAPELLAFAGWGARTPTISRQGRLAFTSAPKDSDIQRLELAGPASAPRAARAPETAISSTRIDHTPQCSPDGSRIAFASDRSGNHQIWVCDRDGSNALQLTSFNGPYSAGPIWSPDGRWIVFGSRPEGRQAAYLVSSGGGAPRRLVTDSEAAPAGWSRNGKWIYLDSGPADSRATEHRIWKITPDGSAVVPVTKGPALGRALESPDGRFLYYLRDSNTVAGLWRMRLPSGEPEKILDSVFGQNFAVTVEGVFFIPSESHTSIQFLRLADRRVSTVFPLGNSLLAFGMSLAPDHRSLLFSVFINHPIDLMMVENFR